MAYTQSDLDQLDKNIASGVKELQHSDGSRIVFRSLEEMQQARQRVSRELDGSKAQSRTTYATFGDF